MTNDLVLRIRRHLNNNKLTVFVGSDLPERLTGIPGRSKLARQLALRHDLPVNLALSEVAQRVERSSDRFSIINFLERQIDCQEKAPGLIHTQIAALPLRAVVTICYDNLLEQAYQDAKRAINVVVSDSSLIVVQPETPTLYKLYGDFQKRDALVITEDDQYDLWHQQDKQHLLQEIRHLLRTTTTLWIGHDLSDPNFKMLWREIVGHNGTMRIRGFAVTPSLSEAERAIWEGRQLLCIDAEPELILAELLDHAPLPTQVNRRNDMLAPRAPAQSVEQALKEAVTVVMPGTSRVRPQAAGLTLWLRGLPAHENRYEVLVTFRPPDDRVEEHLLKGSAPQFVLTPEELLVYAHDLDSYGQVLTDRLFVDRRLAWALQRAEDRARGAKVALRVRLQIDPEDVDLHGYRWELLKHPLSRQFLAPAAQTLISRYIRSSDSTPLPQLSRARPTVLLAIAAPSDLKEYGLPVLADSALLNPIRAALAGFSIGELPHTTLSDLIAGLQDQPAVLILIAHGMLSDYGSVVFLEDERGRAAPISADRLAEAIRNGASRPQLAVLASCVSSGASYPGGGTLTAFGPLLAQAGLGAVIAMHDYVTIQTIKVAVPVLFQSLLRHGEIDRAVAEMRNVLANCGDQWWQPVLYMRHNDGRLW